MIRANRIAFSIALATISSIGILTPASAVSLSADTILIAAASSCKEGSGYVVDTVSVANLRAKPSTKSKSLAKIPAHVNVTICDNQADYGFWYKVNYKGKIGFIRADLVNMYWG